LLKFAHASAKANDMKLAAGCYHCLRRLILQATELATDDPALRQTAIGEATKILEDEFSYDQLSIVIATRIHEVIRSITGNPDPYRARKEREMSLAGRLYAELSAQFRAAYTAPPGSGNEHNNPYRDALRECIRLAAAANSLDFFKETHSCEEDLRRPVEFAIDDSAQLEAKLRSAGRVLYLADNAGEVYFDLPLVGLIRQSARVVYAAKPSPVQNDLTLADLRRTGLASQFGEVMSTGVAAPGVVFSLASAPFRREFESADLVLAKGMGHYEALSELPSQGRVFYCLMAKCQPVAASLGVPIDSYVAMLR
jgi:damage-control phosphatase, subfamily I